MPRLTKTTVEKAVVRDKQYTIWDDDLKGFGVFVNPSGKRSYFVDYRTTDGARRRMTIGAHGAVTAEQARKLAIETLGEVVLKKDDPLTERRTRRKSLTVAELCDNYLKAAEKGLILGKARKPKKASTLETDRGRIERHIKPLLGKKLVIDLNQADVARFIRDVAAGKTRLDQKSGKLRGRTVVDGGAGTATRTAGLLGGILSYAVSEGVITANPAHGVKRPAGNKKERRLDAAEYRALGKALKEADQEPWQAIAIIRLLALTGARRGEIVNLKRTELDLDGSALRLGDTKTGASVRPIGSAAVEVFRDALAKSEGELVFPGVRDPEEPYGGIVGAMERIVKAAKLAGVSAHTLRHSFASVAADLDYSDSTIGALLGHAGTTITSRYTHRLDSVLVAAADEVCSEVERQMGAAWKPAGGLVDEAAPASKADEVQAFQYSSTAFRSAG